MPLFGEPLLSLGTFRAHAVSTVVCILLKHALGPGDDSSNDFLSFGLVCISELNLKLPGCVTQLVTCLTAD